MSAARTAGFFTLGVLPEQYHLPHPRLGLPVILLIRRVLLRAFERHREQSFNLAEASEDEVTAALRSVIENNLRQSGEVRGFKKRNYDFVSRQGQWANYNGSVLTKAPDLFFKLRDDDSSRGPVLSEFDGLFIEAKPVDSTHSAGGRYCDDGLIRFVRGDYAWAMQEAMMLAYARNGRTIAKYLLPAMSEASRIKSLQTEEHSKRLLTSGAAATKVAEAVHVSRHRRDFSWLHGKGDATPIDVFHVWCSCDS